MDVEATPAHRTQEVESTKTMVQRVEDRFDCSRNVAIKTALFIEHARCRRGVQAAPRSSALPA